MAEHLAEGLDEGRFAGPRYTGDTDTESLARSGEKSLQYALRFVEVFRSIAFDQRDGFGQRHTIPFRHTIDVLLDGHFLTERHFSKRSIRVFLRPGDAVCRGIYPTHDRAGEFRIFLFRYPAGS